MLLNLRWLLIKLKRRLTDFNCRDLVHIVVGALVTLLIFAGWSESEPKTKCLSHNHIPVWNDTLPVIYALTPTYTRYVQKAELTRLSNTLRLVENLYWIVVEDSDVKTKIVHDVLVNSGIKFAHLNAETPLEWKINHTNKNSERKPRGIQQRNAGLHWVREFREQIKESGLGGVLYFMDDDNTYSLELFDEIRFVQKVGVLPVGFAGGVIVEKPVLNDQGKVTGWSTGWRPDRKYAIDMAGFAININLILQKSKANFSYRDKPGLHEGSFLGRLVNSYDDLEPLADKCTKVYVWHTKTMEPVIEFEEARRKKGNPSDLGIEV